jgi:hypothetical protein
MPAKTVVNERERGIKCSEGSRIEGTMTINKKNTSTAGGDEGEANSKTARFISRPLLLAGGWILTTIGSAALGFWATSFLDRARPEVTITDIRTTAAYDKTLPDGILSPALLKDPFFEELVEDAWMTDVDPRRDSADRIAKTLDSNVSDAKELVEEMTAFRAIYPELLALTEASDTKANAELFFEKWRTLDSYIYAAIKGDIRRGTFIPPALADYDGSTRYLLIDSRRDKEDGQIIAVHKVGGMFGSSLDNNNKPELNEISMALAYFDRIALRKYIDDVKQDAERVREIEKILGELPLFIDGFSRLAVNVLITNSGEKATSFSPEATMYVNSDASYGYVGNQAIGLGVYSEKGELQPVTVKGGETKLVTFISKELVVNLPRWKELLGLFGSSSRNCFIALKSEGDPWQPDAVLTSQIRQFGPVTGKDALTENDVRRRFGASR